MPTYFYRVFFAVILGGASLLPTLPSVKTPKSGNTAKAVDAGGNTYNEPRDHGFMYGHGFQDPDGHVWELIRFL